MSQHAVVHYAEIGLKGRNRPFFERMLVRSIQRRMEPLGLKRVERLSGRLLVHTTCALDQETWAEALRTVFGVAHLAPAWVTQPDMDAIRQGVLAHLPDGPVDSFRVSATRADKTFPLTSPEIERELGAAVQQQTGWTVQLRDAALEIAVELLRDRAIVSYGRTPGPGGLPVGASGKIGLLLSGGIDSPVAGYLALKRGCRVIPIHFHSRPFGDWMSAEAKARELVRALTVYGIEPYLLSVAIGRQQREITARTPAALRVILYRRLMVRLAEILTRRAGGKALFTGESLGQVASQTLESLAVVEQAAGLPILRPLVGADKQEIIDRAEEIGTLSLSQMEGDDCCQFLMPRRVVTRPQLDQVLEAEAHLDVDHLVSEALDNLHRIDVA